MSEATLKSTVQIKVLQLPPAAVHLSCRLDSYIVGLRVGRAVEVNSFEVHSGILKLVQSSYNSMFSENCLHARSVSG